MENAYSLGGPVLRLSGSVNPLVMLSYHLCSDIGDFVGRDNGPIALVFGNKGRSKTL